MKVSIINIRILALGILFFSFNCKPFSQNLITVSNTQAITLGLSPSFEAGAPVSIISDNSKWLNYTILQAPTEPTYSISVQLLSGSIPAGMEVRIKAGQYIGNSRGNPGRPTKQITLINTPQVLINNIGTSYTGSSLNEGHRLFYSIVITNYSALKVSSPTINILYTISQ